MRFRALRLLPALCSLTVLMLAGPVGQAEGADLIRRTVDLDAGDPMGQEGMVTELRYLAARGERNRLRVTSTPDGLVVADGGARQIRLRAPGCQRLASRRVRCVEFEPDKETSIPATRLIIDLGAGADRAEVGSTLLPGPPAIHLETLLDGGPGPDRLTSPGTRFLSVRGGGGNDLINVKILHRAFDEGISCGPGRDRALVGSLRYRIAKNCERVSLN